MQDMRTKCKFESMKYRARDLDRNSFAKTVLDVSREKHSDVSAGTAQLFAVWRTKQHHNKWHMDCLDSMQHKLGRAFSTLESRKLWNVAGST